MKCIPPAFAQGLVLTSISSQRSENSGGGGGGNEGMSSMEGVHLRGQTQGVQKVVVSC